MIAETTFIQQLGTLSYVGIWFVSLLSNVIIPFPEEITLLALGYLSGTGHVNILILLPIVISALILSDIIMYSLSKRGSKFITWLYQKFFSKKLISKNDAWFDVHTKKIIFFSRFLMQLRFLGPFLAGQRKTPFKTFIKYDLSALLIYVPLYLFLGLFFHRRVKAIIENANIFRNVILGVLGLFVVYFIFKIIYKKLFYQKSIN
jgi:membrane protein DedA with SNARE-associated domain